MAKVKNSFMRSKMNKDLDDRLLPNGEYRDALNVSINKSQGDGSSEGNVGTIQTVLGNTLIADFQSLATPNLPDGVEVIGVLPSDSTNSIYAFITNNILDPYVPPGSIGLNTTYPASQDTSTGGPISLTTPGTGYATTPADGTTTGGTGTGLTVSVNLIGEALASVEIMSFGSGYSLGDVITIDGGNNDATITVVSLLPSYSAIVSFNVVTNSSFKIIVEGSWLNFSTQAPVYAINLLEDLLFFTDNRNQPRKVNINQSPTYYTTEDQISVAKYYPYESIELYQPSPIAGSIIETVDCNTVNNSKTITILSGAGPTSPDRLGVTGIAVDISAGGSGYLVTGSTLATAGGSGVGLTVSVTAEVGGAITGINIVSQGQGYNSGDTVVVTSGNNDAELSISAVLANTFVTDATNWPTSVLVNQTQTLPAGMTINFVSPETTMQDGDDLYLPTTATAGVTAIPAPTTTTFSVKEQSYKGFFGDTMVGHSIYLFTTGSLVPYVDTGSKIVSIIKNASNIDITCAPALSAAFNVTDQVLFAIPNPYYDSSFAENANADFLKDKFVRFSYRFRFDDGEYSLIAPFTQPCFIPQQDGYFLNANSGTNEADDVNEVSDEEAAYRSTEVAFMENKVNKILLNVPLPSTAGSLGASFKVTELEILYKESDQLAIKVVESIPLQNNISGNNNYYQYEYGSKPPFKTLPSKETTRVFDKVPVRALSQEVISNRIVYGNYQDKHTPPAFLDYNLGATPKEDFIISKNEVNSFTSSVEYPNATLKQNRNFEVGVVLADRFGRQSTIIFSKQSQFAALNQFLASSIFSPYRGDDESEPIAGIQAFDGNSLKIEFNNLIQSDRNVNSGTPGLYNGDITSADYNPLGWYSFKIVVKQIEQEYYNAYIPAAMACYPFVEDREKELDQTSHIVLYNDNINKIPRDLTEVGPAQRDFRSSVRMFGRVTSLGSISLNTAFFPEKIADISSNVATIKDLFDYESFKTLVTTPGAEGFLFYNFNYISAQTPGSFTSFPDSSSLVARISTQEKFGVQIEATGTYEGQYSGTPALNVYEIEPAVSLLDIYYETSTSGTIDQLNKAIDEGADSAFAFIDGPTKWTLTEGATDLQDDFCGNFQPVRLDGNSFPNPIDNICILTSVVDGNGNPTDPISGVPYFNPADVTQGIFNIAPGSILGTFKIVLSKTPSGSDTPGLVFKTLSGSNILPNNFIFTFNCQHPETGNVVSTLSFQRALINVLPPVPTVMSSDDFDIPITPVSLCQKLQPDPTLQVVVSLQPSPGGFGPESTLATVQGDNGSSTVDLDEQDLSFDIRSMSIGSAPGTTPVSYSPIPQNEWNDHWRLENSTTANINRDLIAGGDFQTGRSYLVEIAAVDASGFYGESCYASFRIESIVSAEFNNSGLTALLSPCPNSTNLGSIFSGNLGANSEESGISTDFSTNLKINGGDAKATFTLSMESNGSVSGDFEAQCILNFLGETDTSGNPVAFNITINGPIATTSDSVQFNLPGGFDATSFGSSLFIKSAGGTLVGLETVKAKLTFEACKLV
jgi:hypothetical protein